MKSRASTHLLMLLLIIGLTALGYYTIYRAALIRGYEPSFIYAARNLLFFVPLLILPLFMSRFTRFAGNYILLTTAVLLFSFGLVGQYRLFSDPEYAPEGKAEAREQKIETLQMRYIKEHYSPEKKQMMGLPATPPTPVDLSTEKPRQSRYTISSALFDIGTWITLFALLSCPAAYLIFRRDWVLDALQNNGFLLVLLTLVPLTAAAVTSQSGKSISNMTPWELSKIPFLLGFAAILAVLYRNLGKTFWGVPRVRDLLPLIFMAIIPFIPFILLKDFGQMLVFSAAYTALYLIAVKRLPQRVVFIGSVLLLVGIFMLAALPSSVQVKVPLLSTVAEPVKRALPGRIHQRFYLWFDALTPPPPDTFWWKEDLTNFYADEYFDEILTANTDLVPQAAEVKSKVDPLIVKYRAAAPGSEERKNLQREINSLRKPLNAAVKERAAAEIKKLTETAYPNAAGETEDAESSQPAEGTDASPEGIQDDPEEAARGLSEEQKDAREKLNGLNEEAWFADDAMQASRATFGLSTGGKTGRGLGLGYVELIPVADSDYIYAALGEEMGLAGGLLIIFALIVFVAAGTRTALDARDMFTKLCAAGLTAFIAFQALVNIGGITRALPMTGITLPFVSHGGFSLITSFIMLGMLLAISHRNGVDSQRDEPPREPPSQ